MKKILETERLILREIEYSDTDGIFELDSNPAVREYLPGALLQSRDDAIPIIDRMRNYYEDYGTGWWAVVKKDNEKFLGWCGVKYNDTIQNGNNGFHELGYRLIESAWGVGYASEAALACRDHAFNTMGLSRLIGLSDPGNLASSRILEKCGMTLRNEFLYEYQGEELPCLWLEMGSDDYKQT